MASQNKTPNMNLPQWQDNEKPEMADFNDAFEKIDTDVTTHLADNASKFAELKGREVKRIYSGNISSSTPVTVGFNGRGMFLVILGHGSSGTPDNGGAIYLVNFWSSEVAGVSSVKESTRYAVSVDGNAQTITVTATAWCNVAIIQVT